MEDNFDYREILGELDDIDELIELIQSQFEDDNESSWTLVFKNEYFAIFADCKGETRIINSNYINNLFLTKE